MEKFELNLGYLVNAKTSGMKTELISPNNSTTSYDTNIKSDAETCVYDININEMIMSGKGIIKPENSVHLSMVEAIKRLKKLQNKPLKIKLVIEYG